MAHTHNYTNTNRWWGHDLITLHTSNGGDTATLVGTGLGIYVGDFIIVSTQDGDTTRYLVEGITRIGTDVWQAQVRYAPRAYWEKKRDQEQGIG